jgi:hypothetical protein
MARFVNNLGPVIAGGTASISLNAGREDNVVGSIFSDQPGTLWVEQTPDGVNYDVSASYPVVANTALKFSETIIWPTVKLRFVSSGGSTTTVFRLYARESSAGIH